MNMIQTRQEVLHRMTLELLALEQLAEQALRAHKFAEKMGASTDRLASIEGMVLELSHIIAQLQFETLAFACANGVPC